MSENCVNPAEIREGDLTAYIEGAASDAVNTHLRRCAYCRAEMKALRSTLREIRAVAYRATCPPPELLYDFYHHSLSKSRVLGVARHVRECPSCAEELAFLAREERADAASWLDAAIRNITAILRPPMLNLQPARGAEARLLIFDVMPEGEDSALEVTINLRDGAGRNEDWQIEGAIEPEAESFNAELYRDGKLIDVTRTTEAGRFTFDHLAPANYDIHLFSDQRDISLAGVTLA